MNTIEEILNKVLDDFFRRHPVSSECTLFIGFSGGPDSCALALLLSRLFGPRRLTLTYLNHRLRSPGEQEEEELFVERFAREGGFGLIVQKAPYPRVPAQAFPSMQLHWFSPVHLCG